MDSRVPQWAIGLAVVVTAVVTIWVMVRWRIAPDFAAPPPQFSSWSSVAGPAWSSGLTAAGDPRLAARPTAAVASIPLLRAGARPIHADRGMCTSCHTVLSPLGTAIPAIHAGSPLGHEFRGVCGNCHSVTLAGPNEVFAAAPPATALPPGPPPSEGQWLGMEVSPITAITAAQFALPPGSMGVVVTEAEAAAAAAGFLPGDVITSVDGAPVAGMMDFLGATRAGALPRGAVELRRGAQSLWAQLSAAPAAAPGVAAVQAWPTPTGPGGFGAPAGF